MITCKLHSDIGQPLTNDSVTLRMVQNYGKGFEPLTVIRHVGDVFDVGPEADVAGTETSASALRQDDLEVGGHFD